MQTKPNFIFILLDDMGWRDLACTGSTFYETPNIDKLCREGMNFTSGYAACPVCSPSRASYLSGKYPARVGITDWIDNSGKFHPIRAKLVEAPYLHHLPADEITIAKRLNDAGYATWHVGKWHLGMKEFYPEKFGFEKNIGGCDWGHPHNGYFSPFGIETLPDGEKGEYLTDRITDEAIKLISSDEKRPFYLSLCHYAVHTPIQAKPEDIEKFEKKAREQGLDKEQALIKGEPHPTDNKRNVMRRKLQSDTAYAAMIWNLDQNIGKMMDALKTSGKMDNTVVIFTSDNGGLATAEGSPTCNSPASEGKGWMYEGGTRVPLLVWYPSLIKGGTSCDVPITTPDFFPTIKELAGQDLLSSEKGTILDGVSFAPLLRGEAIEPRPIFWHYPHYGNQGGTPGSSVIFGDFKLIEFYEENSCQLYNLKVDFSEKYNIIDRYPQKAQELKQLLDNWKKDVLAKLPTVNEEYTI